MEDGKWKTDNERRLEHYESLSAAHFPLSDEKFCAACGTESRREFAKYCLVCGKDLQEDYQPLDTLRASNRLPKTTLKSEPLQRKEIENLFKEENNRAAGLTWAFVVYSMVPYLGILFSPGAILMSGVSVIAASRRPYLNLKSSVYSLVLSIVILAVQILLWWLLYIIPELNK